MELLAYIKSPFVSVRFLNRSSVLELQRNDKEAPKDYIARIEGNLTKEFNVGPSSGTPSLAARVAVFFG